ncbi:MAG: amidohydrolase family protein [Quadrisphaera sp.]
MSTAAASGAAVRVDEIDAVDVHVHVEEGCHGETALPEEFAAAAARYFRSDGVGRDLQAIADHYRERRTAAVVFTVDARTQLGRVGVPVAELLDAAADHADVLIPFASVDPRRGSTAVAEARSFVREHGARGCKLHPTLQGFDPSDPELRPLWAEISDLGVPVLIHSGQTGIGAGMPGGGGLKLRYSNPMLVDDVAADFPDLRIILAHPSVPWQDEAISIATHKPNVFIDLSGWSPKYFPEQLVRAARSFLQDKVLFGSDFPLITPDRWMRDFEGLGIDGPVRSKILKDNAVRLLGLA